MRHVSKQVVLSGNKVENWITLKQYVTKGGFGFVFLLFQIGLSTHIFFKNIKLFYGFPEYRKIFCFFTVLPFGLKSSAYIFTKLLRPLVAYWRRQSIKVVL